MKTIRQTITFKAKAHAVYEALLNEKLHAAFTQAEAKISRQLGGTFTTYDEYAEGKNIELVKNKKIVQTWRAVDWPEGHYSTTVYEFEEIGPKTKLTFTQTDIPEEQFESVKKGWDDFYWKPLRQFLEK